MLPAVKVLPYPNAEDNDDDGDHSNRDDHSSSVDASETLQLINNMQLYGANPRPQSHSRLHTPTHIKVHKLSPLPSPTATQQTTASSNKNRKSESRNTKVSISCSSLSQSASHTPPGVTPPSSPFAANCRPRPPSLPVLETLNLSSVDIRSDSNIASSINSGTNYATTPRSGKSSVSSVASMEWDIKNMKKWNKDKVKHVLFRCTRHSRYQQVKELLERGINPNIMDGHGNTILLVAAQNGSKKLVKTALRFNANINHQNFKGNTATHYAFAYGYRLLAEYILSKGADDQIRNQSGLLCYGGIKPSNKSKILSSSANLTADALSPAAPESKVKKP